MRALMVLFLLSSAAAARGQDASTWRDPSPHQTRFVSVEAGVELEVLDWGGRGRPLVLLHGSGTSAHNFDELAPKLTRTFHVYGVTRRGHGRSTHASSGYSDQRLADDVLRVLDTLALERPVLAGHSMGGGELTTLGRQHSNRLGGLIYIDALADPRDGPDSEPNLRTLSQRLPAGMQPEPEPRGTARTFAGYREWQFRTMGFRFPEADLKNVFAGGADGAMGRYVSPPSIFNAIGEGQIRRDYRGITVPVLAFVEAPRRTYDAALDRYQVKNDDERKAIEAFQSALAVHLARWSSNLTEHVRDVRLVPLAGAGHFMHLTREAEVLREIESFASRVTSR
jgi:non-heme chloroperoxidase